MNIRTQLANYVKFIRGTPTAWAALTEKDPDTLYFISETNATSGKLYLGNKLIGSIGEGSSVTSLSELTDVVINAGVTNNSILVYNNSTKEWEATPLSTVLTLIANVMTGATATVDGLMGLVPLPKAGQQNLYLKGNGSWDNPTAQLERDLASVLSNLQLQIDDILGGDTGSIRSITSNLIAVEVAKIVAGAPEQFDTLLEISEWISNHTDAADTLHAVESIELLNNAVFGANTSKEDKEDLLSSLLSNSIIELLLDIDDTVNGTDGLVSQVATLINIPTLITEINNNISELADKLKWLDMYIVDD